MIDWVIDKEKVMTWLSDVSLRPCDYVSDEYSADEVERYSNDALALLKEQEQQICFLKAMQLQTVQGMDEQELGSIVGKTLGTMRRFKI